MRKVSFKEVVRIQDIVGLVDITGIQQHSINQCQVVHLTRWPTNGRSLVGFKRGRKIYECLSCKRRLIGVAWFCSVKCKVNSSFYLLMQNKPFHGHQNVAHLVIGLFFPCTQIETEARSTPDPTGDAEGIGKYRSLCDMYHATQVGKEKKLLVEPKCSLKMGNAAVSSSPRVQDATPSMCSLNKEATLPKSLPDATPSTCSLNKEVVLPKSPHKGRPTHAPFY